MNTNSTFLQIIFLLLSPAKILYPPCISLIYIYSKFSFSGAEELNLKKDVTSYDDLLDALCLSLKGYNIK
jgi:hypothetical protein